MSYILAQKGKLRKKFPISTWELLVNKNGWVPVEEKETQIVVNKNKAIVSPPSSGDKKVVSDATKSQTQVVKNEIDFVASDDFKKVIEENKISKSNIKDKLDEKEITYKNNSNLEILTAILAKELNNDVKSLKELFVIEEDIKSEEGTQATNDL
jgi:hypothetical protein